MSFVTDEIRAALAGELAHFHRNTCFPEAADYEIKIGVDRILGALVPLWLAQVRAASEHTDDYQMAAAAAEIEKGMTT